MVKVTFTPSSSNRKVGPIPTTRTEASSCSPSCPFLGNGCYASSGPESLHWRRMNGAIDWLTLCSKISKLPKGSIWRHNTAGDLPHHGGEIDFQAMKMLVKANFGRRGFTYTHHNRGVYNMAVIQWANNSGFTVNVSTESVEEADKVMTEYGVPAVAVVPSTETRRFFKTETGRQVIVCPAVWHKEVTCATCKICQKADRRAIVAFPAHGPSKSKVDRIVTV